MTTTQTTDRELLEMAAKAAGYEVEETTAGGVSMLFLAGSLHRWNPLAGDGDALRLAVALLLRIDHEKHSVHVGTSGENGEDLTVEPVGGVIQRDRATRRAPSAAPASVRQPEVVAWALLNECDPQVTKDPEIGNYWKRKGRDVTELYATSDRAPSIEANLDKTCGKSKFRNLAAEVPAHSAPEGWVMVQRTDLEAIDFAMQHMGDTINNMDGVDHEDLNIATPGFEALERLLAARPTAPAQPEPAGKVDKRIAMYEHVRKLTPNQFAELYSRNIRGAGAFDCLVLAAIEAERAAGGAHGAT